jgi:lysophospholipase L1-like esterase
MTAITVAASNRNYASISGMLYDKTLDKLIAYPAGGPAICNMPNSTIVVSGSAFYECNVTTVIMSNHINTIGAFAFYSCASLTSIVFLGVDAPTSVEANWLLSASASIVGHAYAISDFPTPGNTFNGLTMSTVLTEPSRSGTVALGDSITEGAYFESPSDAYPAQLSALLGEAIRNEGKGGAVTSQMLARFDNDVVSFFPNNVIIEGGVNDLNTGCNATSVETNLNAMISRATEVGIHVYLCTVTPVNGLNATQNAQRNVTNAWIWARSGITVVDLSALEGPTADYVPAYNYGDGIHPNAAGAGVIANAVTAVYDAFLLDAGWQWHYDFVHPENLTRVVQAGGSTDVNIPDKLNGITPLTGIGINCFNDSEGHKLTSILSMPSTVAITGPYAFESCANLTAMTFGSGVTTIGDHMFDSCTALTSITFLGLTTPTSVGPQWVTNNDTELRGHAYRSSNFPAPGCPFKGLMMGDVIDPSLPGNPTGLNAVPGNAQESLNWTAPADNGGALIDYYVINQDGITLGLHTTGLTALITGLINGQSYHFTVAAHNSVGNGPNTTVNVTPFNPLNITIVSPANNPYNNTSIVIVKWITSDSISRIVLTEISTNESTWNNVTGTSYTFKDLSEGIHTVYIRATDSNGNVNTTSVSFTVDTVAPNIKIISPSNNSVFNTSSVTISWTGNDNTNGSGLASLAWKLDSGSWSSQSATTFSKLFTGLADGTHSVSIRATDNAGNSNESSATFIVDTIAPTITAHSPTGSDVPIIDSIKTTINVNFSEAMNVSSVHIGVNGVDGTLYWANNMTSLPLFRLAYNTTYFVNVTGKDLARNAIAYSWSFITMKNEGTIEGVIKDANGNPIANATITLSNGMVAKTDWFGDFTFINVTSGFYNMSVSKDGYQTITQSVNTTAGKMNDLGLLSVRANSSSSDIELIIGILVVIAAVLMVGVLLLSKRKK